MLRLIDICEYIKSQIDVGDGITASRIEESKTRFIGVYNNNKSNVNRTPLGVGAKYEKLKISILVHWDDYTDSEQKAIEIFNIFDRKSNVVINDNHISFFNVSSPVPMGYSGEVYDFIIPVEIIINKEEQ